MRLRVTVLNKILEKKMTAKEFDFFMYLLRYQDDSGKVVGVFHKMVTEEKGMCGQSFYSALYSLRDKGIIKYERVCEDFDIHIIGNEYVAKGKKGKDVQFINLDAGFFHQNAFLELTPNAKLIAIDLYRQLVAAGGGKKWYNRNTFINTYKKKMGLCDKTLQRYLTQLHTVFDFKLRLKIYTISFKYDNLSYEELTSGSESGPTAGELSRRHIAKILLRRSGVSYTDEQLGDLATVYTQYREKVKNTFRLLWDAILNVIDIVGKKQVLPIALVHKLFRCLAGLDSGDGVGNNGTHTHKPATSSESSESSESYKIIEEGRKLFKVDSNGKKIEWKWRDNSRSWGDFWQRYYSPEDFEDMVASVSV